MMPLSTLFHRLNAAVYGLIALNLAAIEAGLLAEITRILIA